MTAPPSLSVVIPAYNAERTLAQLLGALATEKPPGTEVIVVDNGSKDDTPDVARRFGATVLHVEPAGLVGRARNCGWDAACGDVVVFLDADALVHPGWGTGLSRAIAEYPGAVIGCARRLVGRNLVLGRTAPNRFAVDRAGRTAPSSAAAVILLGGSSRRPSQVGGGFRRRGWHLCSRRSSRRPHARVRSALQRSAQRVP